MDDGYHSDFSAVSKTMLNVFCDSPVEYDLTYNQKRMPVFTPTKYMVLGTVAHGVILEGHAFDDVVAIYDELCFKANGHLNATEAAEFRELHANKVCLKPAEAETLASICAAIAESDLAGVVAAASSTEKRHDAELHGVRCRCKTDVVCDLDDRVVAYDLKFCERVDPHSFARQAKRLRYWLQDAHYSAILHQVYGKPVSFRFFAVETKFPYRVQPYWYGVRSREIAADTHKRKLAELLECMETGVWKDRWDSEMLLNPWDVDEEDQLIEFGEASDT